RERQEATFRAPGPVSLHQCFHFRAFSIAWKNTVQHESLDATNRCFRVDRGGLVAWATCHGRGQLDDRRRVVINTARHAVDRTLLDKLLCVPEQFIAYHDADKAELEHASNDCLLPGRQGRRGGANHLLEYGAQWVGILHPWGLCELCPYARRVGVQLRGPLGQCLASEHRA